MEKLSIRVLWKKRWVFALLICLACSPVLQPEGARGEVLRMAKKHSDATTLSPHLATGSRTESLLK